MLKQALLVAGALSLTTSAFALELTNPFYGPSKGSVASTTTYSFNTETAKQKIDGTVTERDKDYSNILTEKLSYGLTDSVSLDASVGNTWLKHTENSGGERYTDTEDRNIDWDLGSTWNVLTGPAKLQVSAAYGQKESKSRGNHGAYKYVTAGAKLGYTLGIYTPYIAGSVERPLFQSRFGDDHAKYEGKAGLYAYCPRADVAVDTGVRVNHDDTDKTTAYTYDLEVSYFLTDNVAVSAFGSYMLDGEADESDLYGKAAGLRLRAAF